MKRSAAGRWGLRLLRLDFGALSNKYVGATERNVRNALALARAQLMSRCVL